MAAPRIVFFDLETLPNLKEVMKIFPRLGAYPGLTLKATVNSVICVGYKVLGEPETHCLSAWDFESWESSLNDDRSLMLAAYAILKDADAVVTHNGRRFDWKFFQTRLMVHGLQPLPKINHIDTCVLAKSNLFMFNNKLETLARSLTDEEKLENGGWDLWVRVSERDPDAMKLMAEYCKQDVIALEAVFNRLRPFVTNMPNYNLFGTEAGPKESCPTCGSTRIVCNGMRSSKTRTYQRLICLDCGSSCKTDAAGNLPRSL